MHDHALSDQLWQRCAIDLARKRTAQEVTQVDSLDGGPILAYDASRDGSMRAVNRVSDVRPSPPRKRDTALVFDERGKRRT